MSEHSILPTTPSWKLDEIQSSRPTTRRASPSSIRVRHHPDHPEHLQALKIKCPRCDSTNTKFCYYNNYSLTQPRHFCKTCRRYWTKGGAIRNVPIGGGCRKNKKVKPSLKLAVDGGHDDSAGPNFFHGVSPSIDYQLGDGLSNPPSCFPIDQTGRNNFNCSVTGSGGDFRLGPVVHNHQNMSSILNIDNNNTSLPYSNSIESLSSLNQNLHWNLQQQQLGVAMPMMIGDGDDQNQKCKQKDQQPKKLQAVPPILFEDPKQDRGFNSSVNPRNSFPFPVDSVNPSSTSWKNGVQAWENFQHYSNFP